MAYDYARDRELEARIDSAQQELIDAQESAAGWESTVSRLGSSVQAKQAALDAAVAFRDGPLAALPTGDGELGLRLGGLGRALASGLGEDALGSGVRSHVGDNVGTMSDASSACSRLIARLESELGDLNTRLASARESLDAADARSTAASSELGTLGGRLSALRDAAWD